MYACRNHNFGSSTNKTDRHDISEIFESGVNHHEPEPVIKLASRVYAWSYRVGLFNDTFNNISLVYCWRQPKYPWKLLICRKSLTTLSHKVVWNAPNHRRESNSKLVFLLVYGV